MLPSGVAIVALRNEKGSYNPQQNLMYDNWIVALRNEKGSYNIPEVALQLAYIVALRNEKGSYNKIRVESSKQ